MDKRSLCINARSTVTVFWLKSFNLTTPLNYISKHVRKLDARIAHLAHDDLWVRERRSCWFAIPTSIDVVQFWNTSTARRFNGAWFTFLSRVFWLLCCVTAQLLIMFFQRCFYLSHYHPKRSVAMLLMTDFISPLNSMQSFLRFSILPSEMVTVIAPNIIAPSVRVDCTFCSRCSVAANDCAIWGVSFLRSFGFFFLADCCSRSLCGLAASPAARLNYAPIVFTLLALFLLSFFPPSSSLVLRSCPSFFNLIFVLLHNNDAGCLLHARCCLIPTRYLLATFMVVILYPCMKRLQLGHSHFHSGCRLSWHLAILGSPDMEELATGRRFLEMSIPNFLQRCWTDVLLFFHVMEFRTRVPLSLALLFPRITATPGEPSRSSNTVYLRWQTLSYHWP